MRKVLFCLKLMRRGYTVKGCFHRGTGEKKYVLTFYDPSRHNERIFYNLCKIDLIVLFHYVIVTNGVSTKYTRSLI